MLIRVKKEDGGSKKGGASGRGRECASPPTTVFLTTHAQIDHGVVRRELRARFVRAASPVGVAPPTPVILAGAQIRHGVVGRVLRARSCEKVGSHNARAWATTTHTAEASNATAVRSKMCVEGGEGVEHGGAGCSREGSSSPA